MPRITALENAMNAEKNTEMFIGAAAVAAACACSEAQRDLYALGINACAFDEMERQSAAALGTRYATRVGTPAAACFLSLMALTAPALGERAVARGDELIVVASDRPRGLAEFEQFGVMPIVADVPHPQQIEEWQLEAALSMQTRAVLLSHTGEEPFDLRTVRNFCNKYDLWLVEDALDAGGASYDFDGTVYRTGTVGDVGTALLCDGSPAVLTNNETLCAVVQRLRESLRNAE